MKLDKKNWQTVRFGDVVYQGKGAVDPKTSGLERYIAGEHMNSEDLHLRQWGTVGEGYLGPAFHRFFEKGDILYGSRRTYLKKVAVADFDGITSNTTFVIKENVELIESGLIPFLMLSDRFTEHSVKNSKGSVNPYINFKDIDKFEFSLPPRDQQVHLIKLLWAADELEWKYASLVESLINVSTSVFEGVYNERSYKNVLLSDCLEYTQYGTSDQLSSDGDVPVLRMNNLQNGRIDLSDLKYINRKAVEQKLLLKKNDILFNRTNSFDLVGKVAIYDRDEEMSFASYLIKLKANESKINPAYLNFYLNSEKGQSAIRVYRTPGVSQSNINPENLKKILVPLLPLKEQNSLVAKLSELNTSRELASSNQRRSASVKMQLINKIFST